ncbi:MAG: hypothetical protein ACO1O6_02725 [Bacteroidota bacterium]
MYLALFKSYFQEKGKNLATKEDVEEITKMVETVKTEIHFQNESKYSLRVEERNSLVNFYEKYHVWLSAVSDVYFGGVNDVDQAKIFSERIYKTQFEFNLSRGKMELFTNDLEIKEKIIDVKEITIEFQFIVLEAIINWETTIFEINQIKTYTPILEQSVKIDGIYQKQRQINQDYLNKKKSMNEKIWPLHQSLKKAVHNHLKRLVNEN